MDQVFQEYLFQKHILVCEGKCGESHVFETLFSLANLLSISITAGRELAREEMISFAAKMLGENVPAPFYKGFPESVRTLSQDQLLFDQLAHYAVTYGFGNFSEAGHSLFEQNFERMAFKEKCEIKEFEIVSEEEAVVRLAKLVEDLLSSTRPLNDNQFSMVRDYIKVYQYRVAHCASKNTAIRLMESIRSLRFARFLVLSDVIKLLDEIQFQRYGSENLKKLNLCNQDRKFITAVIDELFAYSRCDMSTCYEKKAIWCGLLHHIHYQPKCEQAREFVEAMRGKGNASVYAAFEKAMASKDIRGAVMILLKGKGAGALLRNLKYIVSRIEKPEDLAFVLESLDTKNNVILMQLLLDSHKDRSLERSVGRSFRFTRHSTLRVHAETGEEAARRKSILSQGQYGAIARFMEENLARNLKGKLGKVYVEEGMKKIALPLQESTAQGGYGVLAKGSRIAIPEGKKIRAFTYWEKVNDIDLSVIGMTRDGHQREFSWRTMAKEQSEVITFSGDEISGFHGGSEYFDIDLEGFQKLHPEIKYLIFCDNVFSRINFDQCFCKAGFMMRDLQESGEIYEPKTVQTSYRINCPGTFAYLFGIDLANREMVWLNVSREGNMIVAGESSLAFLLDYFDITKVMNVYRFFEMMATELVTDPAQADILVSDDSAVCQLAGPNARETRAEVIHSFDFERLLALMNQ